MLLECWSVVGVLECLLEWKGKRMKQCETIRQACVWWVVVNFEMVGLVREKSERKST